MGLKCVSIDELARSYGFLKGSDTEGEVDTRKVGRRLSVELLGPVVVHGHLLPYTVGPATASKVVVLRCEPVVLKERLISRGYPLQKVVDNVEAELIGLVSSDAFDVYGHSKTFEVDTTKSTPAEAAEAVLKIIQGEARPSSRIDWTVDYYSGAKLRALLSVDEA